MNNLYRIVDANFNRAREGLRVLEEVARFSNRDRVLTEKLRDLRHRISILTEKFFTKSKLLAGRESKTDPGRNFRPERRTDKKDLIIANSFRVSESLRVLEETSALLNPEASRSFQNLRFSFYTLEKSLPVLYRQVLPDYPIYVIIDPELIPENPITFVKTLLAAGAKIFQLRAKKMPDRLFLNLAQEIRQETRKFKACFLVNDRPDIAALSDADGLHLGQEDLSVKQARQVCPDVLVGVSVHSVEQAERAIIEGVDYIAAGSIFSTTSKEKAVVIGLRKLKEIKRISKHTPLVAIGGISPENGKSVFRAGADYVAVISSLMTTHPEKALRALIKTNL